MDSKLKIIFMGTPEFSVPTLMGLLESKEIIECVITQPDKRQGRGLKISSSPVKRVAMEYKIPVDEPKRIKDEKVIRLIKDIHPDLIVVVAYGEILPKAVLDIPSFGCINVHASILPKYRGAAPIQWAIINGEETTGITIMKMDEGLDTGDVILQKKVSISQDDTQETLSKKLSLLGRDGLMEVITLIKNGGLTTIPQDDSNAIYAPLLRKENGKIEWKKRSRDIYNQIRGMVLWPKAFSFLKGRRLNIFKSLLTNEKVNEFPGTIVEAKIDGLKVATGDYYIILKELQLEGRKKMNVRDFLIGYKLEKGEKFGD